MLKRKITEQLLAWKAQPNRNPVILKGCRQCGKTFSVLEFARKQYAHVVYLNFFEHPNYAEFFADSLEIDHIILLMTAALGVQAHFVPGETVIVLDEIQECPQARTALKFFKLDGRFDVIGTGSLLGVRGYGKTPASIPVGYETILDMYPLDFEEFLWACGVPETVVQYLQQLLVEEKSVPTALHNRMRELLLQYTVVGGMPAVVQEFIRSKHMNRVTQLQRDLVRAYEDDMVKYAATPDKPLIKACFRSIPQQLSKENKKFQYSLIQKNGTASKFKGSLEWIEDAGIITRCYNLTTPELPLSGNATQNIFKVYMVDTGLFTSMLDDGTQYDILRGNLLAYKGAIFENLVADIFTKMKRKLYYFRKDSGLEIDFVIRYGGESTLVEVKSTSGKAKSLNTVLSQPDKYHVRQALKLGDYNIGRTGKTLTLPLYMTFLLTQINAETGDPMKNAL